MFLAGSYVGMQEKARQVLLPFDFPDRELIEQSLPDSRFQIPQRGPRRDLIALAEQNARHLLEELKLSSMEAEERAGDPVYELGRELGLQRLPRSLVCFDISTAQGTDTVGSCVWFENGRPKRSEYRKFKVKSVEGADGGTAYFTSRLGTDALQAANDAPPGVPRRAMSLHSDNAVFFVPPAHPEG